MNNRNPWAWVGSLYLAEGLPYVVVMTVSVIMYKGLGISNTDIALYTSWLNLPWVIKPLWSPLVDLLGTRRSWIWILQIVIGGTLAALAFTIPTHQFFQSSLAVLWLLAFSSATQDIAIDGFYLLATTEAEQSFFVGIRSTFFRISTIFGQGLLVILAGYLQHHTGLPKLDYLVTARPGAALIRSLEVPPNPDLASPISTTPKIVVTPAGLEISPEPREATEIKSLLASARSNNVFFGFRTADSVTGKVPAITPGDRPAGNGDSSVFTSPFRLAANHLESFLRGHLSPEKQNQHAFSGNLGIGRIQLSHPPGREVVVTVGSQLNLGVGGGDERSFSVAEGSRLRFDDHNWNQPALTVFQVDPQQKGRAVARMEISAGNIPLSWSATFLGLAVLFLCAGAYHRSILPRPPGDRSKERQGIPQFLQEFARTFVAFFKKPKILILLLFLMFYRFGEAQLVKMVGLFLLDSRESGGLGLTTGQFGFVYGTVGIAALTCGGLLGGMVASRKGLKYWLWWMVAAIHLPDAVFLYLATTQPDNLWIINLGVATEQFGYGFGFTAYMLYMIHIARGEHPTAHYALCTGFMALGMMLPGMWSGWLQELIGYQHFFTWVLWATLPGILVVAFIPLEADFGKQAQPR